MPAQREEPQVESLALARDSLIYVAGHRGLVGSAIWRRLEADGYTNLIGRKSGELDLRRRADVFRFFDEHRPEAVIVAAAKVGGILANNTYPADFLSDNLQIQVNVMDAARAQSIDRLLFLGSSCIYPRLADQPIHESSLLTGPLEPTNAAYAIAKIAGILQVQSVRQQDGLHWISAMPTNLYGRLDNFDALDSHVLPALVRRFHEAKQSGSHEVTIWGTGRPRREFLHSDDLAKAVLTLLDRYDDPETINIGFGSDVSIRELAETVADVVGFTGDITHDLSKPDGTPRKLLDNTRLRELGWRPQIELRAGIADTYEWFQANQSQARL